MLFIQVLATNVVTPYDDLTEFIDKVRDDGSMSHEQIGQLSSFGINDTHAIVEKKIYDDADPMPPA